MTLHRILPVLSLAVALAGCAGLPSARTPAAGSSSAAGAVCADGLRAMVRETLYFGRNRPGGGRVGDAEWRTFVDDVVVPHFPDGFTLIEARGHWRSGQGAIESEPSMLLIVLHDGGAAATASLAAIAAEYKRRFEQEAVLRERSAACAGF